MSREEKHLKEEEEDQLSPPDLKILKEAAEQVGVEAEIMIDIDRDPSLLLTTRTQKTQTVKTSTFKMIK